MSVLKVLSFCLVLLEVLFFFNLLIVVHELGHFLAARWRGAIIEEFGVWFGKPLWRRKYNGVWYSFGSIPLGGFVKLPQLGNQAIEGKSEYEVEGQTTEPADGVEREEAAAPIPRLRPLDRIIVAFAGPLFSFLLALVLACLVWGIGKPTSDRETTTVIGYVEPGGPAAKAGLQLGDKILSIDGHPVSRFYGPVNSVVWAIVSSEGPTINFEILRDGQKKTLASGFAKLEGPGWARNPKRQVGILPLFVPEVADVDPGGVAEKAGMKKGDLITAVNGQPIITWDQLETIVKAAPEAPLHLAVKRADGSYETTLTPQMKPLPGDKSGKLLPDFGLEAGHYDIEHPAPWPQVMDSVHAIGNTLHALASRKSDVKLSDFSGPVGIMGMYHKILSSDEGWRLAIAFSVLFNVNLAIINLLPLPLLDGGHITLGLIEMVRRKPGNARVLEILETACLFTIIGYVLYVSFFDVTDFFPGARPHKPAAASATPAPATPAPQP